MEGIQEKHIELTPLELSDIVEGLANVMYTEEQRGLKKGGRYRRAKRLSVKIAKFAASANLGFQWPHTVVILETDFHSLVKYTEFLENAYSDALDKHNQEIKDSKVNEQ